MLNILSGYLPFRASSMFRQDIRPKNTAISQSKHSPDPFGNFTRDMRDINDRCAGMAKYGFDHFKKSISMIGVKALTGLVQQEKVRRFCQRSSQQSQTLQAGGHGTKGAVTHSREAEIIQQVPGNLPLP